MKKALAITLILAMMLGASAFATKTRVLTMGDNNNILLDEANIWLYPGRLFQYPDMAVAEYNTGSFYILPGAEGTDGLAANNSLHEFGVHWKFGEESPFVLGTYLYNSDGAFEEEAYFGGPFPVGLTTEFFFGDFDIDGDFGFIPENYLIDGPLEFSNRRIGLFYARQLGGYNFGFSFEKLHNSNRYETLVGTDLTQVEDESFSRYSFGLGLTEAQGQWDLAAKFALISWRDKGFDGTDEVDFTKPGGCYNFELMGRYFYQQNPTLTFVPHVGLYMAKVESEDYYFNPGNGFDWQVDPEVFTINAMIVDVGSGMHYTPAAGMLAVLDFGVSLASLKFEATEDTLFDAGGNLDFATYENKAGITTLPYLKMGFEGEVFNWMDVRFGATTYWRSFSIEYKDYDGTTTDKEYNRYPNNMTYLGFSFNWGNLTVDTWTDPELFLDGLNFISGQNNQMNGGISALYNF